MVGNQAGAGLLEGRSSAPCASRRFCRSLVSTGPVAVRVWPWRSCGLDRPGRGSSAALMSPLSTRLEQLRIGDRRLDGAAARAAGHHAVDGDQRQDDHAPDRQVTQVHATRLVGLSSLDLGCPRPFRQARMRRASASIAPHAPAGGGQASPRTQARRRSSPARIGQQVTRPSPIDDRRQGRRAAAAGSARKAPRASAWTRRAASRPAAGPSRPRIAAASSKRPSQTIGVARREAATRVGAASAAHSPGFAR